ncbi:MAG: TetR/AcrR family transcriptional regulator [Gammaproteobacteria bacterium]|nr:TetR/AcrR family transcriptional regulator [Gammaproteobacteria bacterium]
MTVQQSSSAGSWRADPDAEISGQLRARVLAAARTCLAEVGQEKLRMGMIARQAKCSRATLYRYFTSKEEIFLYISVENFQRINAEVDEEIRDISDLRMRFATGLARSMAIARSGDLLHSFTTDMLQRAMLEQPDALIDLATGRIGPIYDIAQEKGWTHPGTSQREAVTWIIMAGTGLLVTGWPVVAGRELNLEEQVQYVCRYLLHPVFDMQDLLQ